MDAYVIGIARETLDKIKLIEETYNIKGIVEENYEKKEFSSFPVISYDELKQKEYDRVVLGKRADFHVNFWKLRGLGIEEDEIDISYVSKKKDISPLDLMKKQVYEDGSPNRLDVSVRYMAVEDYFWENDYGFYLYRKMQTLRCQEADEAVDKRVNTYKRLIKSFDSNGYECDSYVRCYENDQLDDGAHRIACALYFGIKNITIEYMPKVGTVDYGEDWFVAHDFTEKEIKLIKDKYLEITTVKEGGV